MECHVPGIVVGSRQPKRDSFFLDKLTLKEEEGFLFCDALVIPSSIEYINV